MKKTLLTLMIGLLLMGCAKTDNPFFETYKNKFGAPPFDKIKNEHYMPAFKEGIKQQTAEVDSIANSTDAPTFDNTIAKLDFSGVLLKKVSSVFYTPAIPMKAWRKLQLKFHLSYLNITITFT